MDMATAVALGCAQGAASQALGEAYAANQEASEWRNYAKKLEAALFDQKINSKIQFTLKEKALEELRQANPKNWMLEQANRNKIAEQVEHNMLTKGTPE